MNSQNKIKLYCCTGAFPFRRPLYQRQLHLGNVFITEIEWKLEMLAADSSKTA